MSVSVKGGTMVYVGFSRSACDWLRETHPSAAVVSWDELRGTAAGLAEVPEGSARDLRLAEALRYFSQRP